MFGFEFTEVQSTETQLQTLSARKRYCCIGSSMSKTLISSTGKKLDGRTKWLILVLLLPAVLPTALAHHLQSREPNVLRVISCHRADRTAVESREAIMTCLWMRADRVKSVERRENQHINQRKKARESSSLGLSAGGTANLGLTTSTATLLYTAGITAASHTAAAAAAVPAKRTTCNIQHINISHDRRAASRTNKTNNIPRGTTKHHGDETLSSPAGLVGCVQ